MGGGYFSNAGVFLIDAVFGLYIFAVLLRFLFQLVRADFYNPLCQAIVTVTNPPLRPLRRYVPSLAGLDTASILLLLVLQTANTLLVALVLGLSPNPIGLLVVAVAELLGKVVWTFIGAIIIQVILSWVSPGAYNPVAAVVYSLTEPLLAGPSRAPAARRHRPLPPDRDPGPAAVTDPGRGTAARPRRDAALNAGERPAPGGRVSWYNWQGADLLLTIHARPNARQAGIDGLHGAALAVRVAAPARDNRANVALCETLADAFAVPRRQVVLERGHGGRDKRLRVIAPPALPDWFLALGGTPPD